jgi:ribonuclease P protein component
MEQRFRLRRAEDFTRLRQKGSSVHNRNLLLSHMPNGLSLNRYGFVTSGRLGGAVVRNRVRRLLREAVRAVHPQLGTGHDVVLIARQPLIEQPYSVVQQIVLDLARRSGLLIVESDEQ